MIYGQVMIVSNFDIKLVKNKHQITILITQEKKIQVSVAPQPQRKMREGTKPDRYMC